MSGDARNLVFGVSDQVRHKSACSLRKKARSLRYQIKKRRGIVLSVKRKQRCSGAEALLSQMQKSGFTHDVAQIIYSGHVKLSMLM